MTPIEIIAGTVAVFNGTFTLTTVFLKLQGVGEDLKICLQLLASIEKELSYARRLRNDKFGYPVDGEESNRLDHVESVIEDTGCAAKGLGALIQGCRADRARNGRISTIHRFQWILGRKDTFLARQFQLALCHQRLLHIITAMEQMPTVERFSAPPPSYGEVSSLSRDAVLRSPSQRRLMDGKSLDIIETPNQFKGRKFPPLTI
jgi:hypothetical protein